MANPTMGQDVVLFSYVVASADMRHIERSEREIYLRYEGDSGPIVRGEMPDCGPYCYADLGQVMLEYVMSCEGCKDDIVEAEMAEAFGGRLGRALAKKLDAGSDEGERVSEGLRCVLRSLDTPFSIEQTANQLQFDLEYDPIIHAAQQAGIGRGRPMARRALTALIDALVSSLASGWQMETTWTAFDDSLDVLTVQKADP